MFSGSVEYVMRHAATLHSTMHVDVVCCQYTLAASALVVHFLSTVIFQYQILPY